MAPAFLVLGIEAWNGHFAAQEPLSVVQYVPVVFAPLALLCVLLFGASKAASARFQRGLLWLGVASIAVGLIGEVMHLRAIILDLAKDKVSWAALRGALGTDPPLFAPLAFAAVGALLVFLSRPEVSIHVRRKERATQTVPQAAHAAPHD